MSTKTYVPDAEKIEKKWYVVDAEGQVLGRLASQVAQILMGKHKSIYTCLLYTSPLRSRS